MREERAEELLRSEKRVRAQTDRMTELAKDLNAAFGSAAIDAQEFPRIVREMREQIVMERGEYLQAEARLAQVRSIEELCRARAAEMSCPPEQSAYHQIAEQLHTALADAPTLIDGHEPHCPAIQAWDIPGACKCSAPTGDR
jgi:carboxypeptidase C (cathepsin A)